MCRILSFWSFLLLTQFGVAASFTVSNTADSGVGSLRQAITDANLAVGADTINFAIPGAGPHRIAIATDLPDVIDSLVIDGYTQAGSSPATAVAPATLQIEIDAIALQALAGNQISLEVICGDGEVFSSRGIAWMNSDYGLLIRDGGGPHVIQGNWFGMDASGAAAPDLLDSCYIDSDLSIIGGPNPADRNLFGAQKRYGLYLVPNADFCVVENNTFGLGPDGETHLAATNRLSYQTALMVNAAGSTILNNVISGGRYGLRNDNRADVFENVIQGNKFGMDVTGMILVSNVVRDVQLAGTGRNTVGGPNPLDGNRMASYGTAIYLYSANNTNNVVQGNVIGHDATGLVGIHTNYRAKGSWAMLVNSPGNDIRGNTLGHTRYGIACGSIDSYDNHFRDNWIGVTEARDDFLETRLRGFQISGRAHNNIIGGPNPGDANVLGWIDDYATLMERATNNWFEGNYMGVLPDGTEGHLRLDGCYSYSSSVSNTFYRNIISNARYGFLWRGTSTFGNVLSENVIRRNSLRTIELNQWDGVQETVNVFNQNDDLDADFNDANRGQNHPVLTFAYLEGGTFHLTADFHGAPNTPVTVEFFSNPSTNANQLTTFLFSQTLTTDAAGNASFSSSGPVGSVQVGQIINATATTTDGTSEVSLGLEVTEKADLHIQTTMSPNPAAEGQAVQVTVQVSNLGPGTARDLSMIVPLWGLEYTSDTVTAGTFQPDVNAWIFGDLSAGQSATLTISATVNIGFGGRNWDNNVPLTGAFTDLNPANDDFSIQSTATCPGGVQGAAFVDRDGDGVLSPGDSPASGLLVQALDGAGNVLASAYSSGTGFYTFPIPAGTSVTVAFDTSSGHWDPVGAGSLAVTSPACSVDLPVLPSRRFTAFRHPPGPSSRVTPLTLTEIHYHPADRIDGRNLEFLEFYNSDPVSTDLTGFQVDGDVEYTFPPGSVVPAFGYLVIAANPQELYPETSPGTLMFGPYIGSLDNGGGKIRLEDAHGRYLLEVDFDDRAPWPRSADGHGHSINLNRPSYGEQDAKAWGASALLGGSPGRHDPLLEDDIVINEVAVGGFVEVFNRGEVSHLVSGMRLTTNMNLTGYTIPSGNLLAPGGRVAFPQVQMGIDLSTTKALFLVDPSANRIRDVVAVGLRLPGSTFGRSPDGSERIHELATTTPAAANANPVNREIVISEIMYSPISNEDADEYLELVNRSPAAANLSGWRFTDGIDFTFPAGASVPSGGYVVLAKDAARLIARYPSLNASNTFGDYNGTLANKGEPLILVDTNGALVDEVVYGDGGRWGEWSDGGGSSLELIDLDADNSDSSNWRDSDESGKSSWQTFTRSGVVEHATHDAEELHILHMKAGEFMLDDVSVTGPGGQVFIPPAEGGFEAVSNGWGLLGNHVRSEVIDTESGSGANSLHVRASGAGNYLANLLEHDLATNTLVNGSTVTLSLKARWVRGNPFFLSRLWGNGFEMVTYLDVPAELGTPGAPNSMAVANAGPGIRDVRHSPVFPNPGQAVTIQAEVADTDGVGSVNLRYRVNPAAPTTNSSPVATIIVAMLDNGVAPDVRAGDGVYTIALPPQGSNTLVGFSIEATDSAGGSHVFPDAPRTYEGNIRWGEPAVSGTFADTRLWVNMEEIASWSNTTALSNEPHPGTIVLNGHRVIYHGKTRYRGSPFSRPRLHEGDGPLGIVAGSYALIPPKDDRIWNSTRININIIGNSPADDSSSIREKLAYQYFNEVGLPKSEARYIKFSVDGVIANEGGFYYDIMNPGDTDFLWSNYSGADAGTLHKANAPWETSDTFGRVTDNNGDSFRLAKFLPYPSANDPRYAKPRYRWKWTKKDTTGKLDDDFNKFFDFIDVWNSHPSDDDTFLAAMDNSVDLHSWFAVNASQQYMADFDSVSVGGAHNNHIYLPPGDKWHIINRDLDFGWGYSSSPSFPLFAERYATHAEYDVLLERAYTIPALRRLIFDHLRRSFETPADPLHPFQVCAYLNKWAPVLEGEGMPYYEMSEIKDWVAERRTYLLSVIPQATLAIDQVNYTTGADTATLTGTAPVSADSILLNGNAYPVTWLTDTQWQVEVPIVAGANPFALTASDFGGTLIGGVADNVTVTKTGPTPNAAGNVVINEVDYHSFYPDADFVELHNLSSVPFDLSGWRLDGVDLDIPGGTVIAPGGFLVFAEDANGFRAANSLIPVAGEYNGSLDNAGESLRLLDASSNVVDAVRLEDTFPYPLEADGLGPSLQRIDAAQSGMRPGNWDVDLTTWATPNATNSIARTLPTFPDVWINEVQPGASRVELLSVGASSLAGTYLSANPANLTASPLSGSLNGWSDRSLAIPAGPGLVLLTFVSGGETIVLDAIDTATFSSAYSYGSYPDGDPLSRMLFHTPTPAAANNPASVAAPVLLNEWLASNQSVNMDPADGDSDDWFELHHSGGATADLSMYFVSEDPTDPGSFQLPFGTTIGPDGHLLLWADGETGQGADHVPFKLASVGQSIALFTPDGVLVDTVTFGQQTADQAEGRWKDAEPAPFWAITATPNAPNRVADPNTPPVILNAGPQNLLENAPWALALTGFDPEAAPQSLQFSLLNPPSGISITPAGVLSWTPNELDAPGTVTLQVKIEDDGYVPASSTFSIVLNVIEDNQPPVAPIVNNWSAFEKILLTVPLAGSDPDLPANTLSYQLLQAPAGAQVDPQTGMFLWMPTESQGGNTYTMELEVSDGNLTDTVTWTVSVIEVNHDPELVIGPLSSCNRTVELLPASSDWRYRDNGIFPGSGWARPAYNDAGWSVGSAKLGYGEGNEGTVISYGADSNNRHLTTWLRRHVFLDDVDTVQSATLHLLRDDGAVVYLNGAELLRSNMPGGTITANTPAAGSVFGANESKYYAYNVPANLLVPGVNTLAVEVHQFTPNSNDLGFDLRLEAVMASTCGAPVQNLTLPAGGGVSIDFAAIDPDSSGHTFALLQSPAGFTIDPATGVLAGAFPNPGTYTFEVQTTDNGAPARSDSVVFQVQVTGPLMLSVNALRSGNLIQWPSSPGTSYRVEFCDDLIIGSWNHLQTLTATANLTNVNDPAATPAMRRIYRIAYTP